MANIQHLIELDKGSDSFTLWLISQGAGEGVGFVPDFSIANLDNRDLSGFFFKNANFRGASLLRADLTDCYLKGADLSDADIRGCVFSGAKLAKTNLDRTQTTSPDTNFDDVVDPLDEIGKRER